MLFMKGHNFFLNKQKTQKKAKFYEIKNKKKTKMKKIHLQQIKVIFNFFANKKRKNLCCYNKRGINFI